MRTSSLKVIRDGYLLAYALGLLHMANSAGFAASAGSTAVEVLNFTAGARGSGMGDAQAALADDVFAPAWNPAGLGNLSAPEFSFMQNQHVADIVQQHAALAIPFSQAGTLGLSLTRLAMDDFQGFDANGNATSSIKSDSKVINISWGRKFFSREDSSGGGLSFGGSLKSFQEYHAGESAQGVAGDFGVLIRPWGRVADRMDFLRRTSLAAVVKNLGPGIKFDDETFLLPLEVVSGAAYSHFISGDVLTLAADLHQPSAAETSLSAGIEYLLKGFLALRMGYKTSRAADRGFQAGAGFRFRQAQVDYAWVGYGDALKAAHQVSLNFRLGHADGALRPGLAEDLFGYYMSKGAKEMAAGLYDKAILLFNQALKIRPGEPEAIRLLFDCGKKLEESSQFKELQGNEAP